MNKVIMWAPFNNHCSNGNATLSSLSIAEVTFTVTNIKIANFAHQCFCGKFILPEKYNLCSCSCKVPTFCPFVKKFKFSRHTFINNPNTKFKEIRAVGAVLLHVDRRMDGRT